MSYSGKLFGVIPYEVRKNDKPYYSEIDVEAMLGMHYGCAASVMIFVDRVFHDDKHTGNILTVDCLYDHDEHEKWFNIAGDEDGVGFVFNSEDEHDTSVKYAHQIEYAVQRHFTNDSQLTLIHPEDIDKTFDFETQAEVVQRAKKFVDINRDELDDILEGATPGRVGVLIRAKLAGIDFSMSDSPDDIYKKIEQKVREKHNNIVKRACKELGITQKELADRLGITPSAISQWGNDVPKTAQVAIELMMENNQLKKDIKVILEGHAVLNRLAVQNLDT